MRYYDDDSMSYIECAVVFSGKRMPGVGEDRHWTGSGSLSGISRLGVNVGELLSPDEVRGKALVPFGFSVFERR
jgi:hypothetical protein